MANTFGELHNNASVYPNQVERKQSRRNVILVGGVALLGAGGAIIGINKYARTGESSPRVSDAAPEQPENITKRVSILESRANIAALEQSPALFSDGIDPHDLLDCDYEELVDLGGVIATDANKNDFNVFAQDWINTVKLIIRAGGTEQDLLNLIDEGFEIGVRNENGMPIAAASGLLAKSANKEYGEPMLSSWPDSFNGAKLTPVKDAILRQQYFNADLFQMNATSRKGPGTSDPTLNTTTDLKMESVEELSVYESEFHGLDLLQNVKRVKIDFQTERGTLEDMRTTPSTATVVYAEVSGSDKFLILPENYTLIPS